MNSYHGTSSSTAVQLVQGKVDVTFGGGELGQGFYTGEYIHLAKAWAFHISGDKQNNVVKFEKDETDVFSLSIHALNRGAAVLTRNNLRHSEKTRTYKFGFDMVWAPIVGTSKVTADQYKWETAVAQNYLNGATCKRVIV